MVEFLSTELRDELVGEPARGRFDTGTAKLCSPLAYDENALELAELVRRAGDLALPNLEVDPSTGDFDRATEEKGDEVDAYAPNPERFVAEVEGVGGGSTKGGLFRKEDTGV
jgi:hypothetical protein